jgi:hypothetical protein
MSEPFSVHLACLRLLQELAASVEAESGLRVRALASTTYTTGVHVQLGQPGHYSLTFDYQTPAEAAAFFTGVGETFRLLNKQGGNQ